MGSGIYTYRVKDGRYEAPFFDGVGFIVTAPDGHDIPTPWHDFAKARAFCADKNRKLKESAEWPTVN